MEFVRSREVDAIKARLDHPVIDSDGHAVEYIPVVAEILREQAGPALAERFALVTGSADAVRGLSAEQRRDARRHMQGWWAVPAANTLDRATAMLPALMAARLPELGLDHAVIYGTLGLGATVITDDELRPAMARAFNTYYAEAFGEHRELLTAVGVIPMGTPTEALTELDHATSVLGLKAFVFGGPISRKHPDGGTWLDNLIVDSLYDYDPVWQRCIELGVAPTFHTAAAGWGSRTSPSSYVFNHIGMFATGCEAMARAMFLGGVPHRFPELRVAFQEGGVAWAASLLSDIKGHWEKRNRDAVRHYDPSRIDRPLIADLFRQHGGKLFGERDDLDAGLRFLSNADDVLVDEFAASGVETEDDITRLFTERFHFGCEADDPMTALAFGQPRLKAIFASDIGHWDVPDARGVLPEAWELVEHGMATEEDFRDLTYANPRSLWVGANPKFFDGTSIDT
ncbi:MAG: Amidohydrolase [Actinomycetia bacterium]|nr:Amidohydrolase [Actinomycetes bacterium]